MKTIPKLRCAAPGSVPAVCRAVVAATVFALARVSLAVAAPGDAPAVVSGETSATDASLALKLRNPIADQVTVPIESDFEYGPGPRHALTYTLNVQPVVPFNLNKDWLLVTRTIVPFIHQQAAAASERDRTGLGDINQSFFFSPARLVGGWIVGAGPVLQYPTATRPELGTGKWGAGPTFAVLQQHTGWTFGVLANQIWSYAGDRRREPVNTALVDPFASYTWPNGVTLEFDGGSTYDWKLRQWTIPLTAGVSRLVTLGHRSVTVGLDGRWYAARAPGSPVWGIVLTVTLVIPK